MLLYLATYDIESNKTRKKAADLLLSYGLYRVQKSVYLGLVSKAESTALLSSMLQLFSRDDGKENRDKFYFIPMSKPKFNKMTVIGEKPDLTLILRTCSTFIV